MTKQQQAQLDKQLAHWAATDAEHTANMKRRATETAHDLDHFDHRAYQRMIYTNGWNK